jgi:hypothetical protein
MGSFLLPVGQTGVEEDVKPGLTCGADRCEWKK